MRLGETVACRIGADNPRVTHWDANAAMIHVRTAIDSGAEHAAKTTNSAMRIVDLCQAANDYLIEFAGDRSGFLFASSDGGHLSRSGLYRASKALKLPGGFHTLRRARVTWLYKQAQKPAHEQLLKFWIGHESHEGS